MKLLGVGLSKTGTSSLHKALEILGLRSLHYTPLIFRDILLGTVQNPSFRRFDNVDAVSDLPAAYYYNELLSAYPQAKAILTIRETNEWWKSIENHFNKILPINAEPTKAELEIKGNRQVLNYYIRNITYGSHVVTESLYKKKFEDHNRKVQAEITSDRLLVMDICGGDGWEKLCPFLGLETPDTPFPHSNKTPGN